MNIWYRKYGEHVLCIECLSFFFSARASRSCGIHWTHQISIPQCIAIDFAACVIERCSNPMLNAFKWLSATNISAHVMQLIKLMVRHRSIDWGRNSRMLFKNLEILGTGKIQSMRVQQSILFANLFSSRSMVCDGLCRWTAINLLNTSC